MNITESRLPQDGRISVSIMNKSINLSVSTLPTVYGEKIVIRILDLTDVLKKLNDLDFSESTLNQYEKMIKEPSGLILITGPTGSLEVYDVIRIH